MTPLRHPARHRIGTSQRPSRKGRAMQREPRGFSLIEVLAALTILSMVLLAIAKAGFVTARTLDTGRSYMTEWTAAKTKLDSLAHLGWAALDGEKGSDVVAGHNVTWEVQGVNPRTIVLVVERKVLARTRADTFAVYVADR